MIKCLNIRIEQIIKLLKNGWVGVLPTDTIYGLVGSALSQKAVEKNLSPKKQALHYSYFF